MLILKSLSFQNIGRFTELQTIDFTQINGITQIEGQNNITSGSSGAGKSTIFKALDFCLGLDGPSTNILQSRLAKEIIQVTALFDYDGLPLKIERGKKLLIDLNGEITTGSSKLTEEKLDQIIGMDRSLFRKILHKRQNEGGFFLDMAPSAVHQFLTNCLGLTKERSKIDILDLRITELTKSEVSIQSQIESNKMGLTATSNACSSLSAPEQTVHEETIELLEKCVDSNSKALEKLKIKIKSEMDIFELSRPKITSVPFDRSRIEIVESIMDKLKSDKSQSEKREQDRQSDIKSQISELQMESTKLSNAELTRQSEVKAQISSLKSELSNLQSAEKDRQAKLQKELSNLQIKFITNQTLLESAAKARQDALLLHEELKQVRQSICPTCTQGWINESCKTKEAELLSKILECKKTCEIGTEAGKNNIFLKEQSGLLTYQINNADLTEQDSLINKIQEFQEESKPRAIAEVIELSYKVEFLKQSLVPQNKEILESIDDSIKITLDSLQKERKAEQDFQSQESAKQQDVLTEFNEKQTQLRDEHQSVLKLAESDQQSAKSEFERAKQSIESYNEQLSRFHDSMDKLNKQTSDYMKTIQELSEELLGVSEELELATESKTIIKSYLSCSFENALESIGDSATRKIRRIPNMQTATIQFDGLKETASGKIKEEVVCNLSMDGEIAIPVKSLSGGEKSSVDLAVDLSVIAFIEETTQKGCNVMMLDECFTGLDTANIVEALEMLKDSCSDKKLLIVDHNQVASQSIENKIIVIRDGLTSRIVQ